jgi:hypothetical protein
MPQLSSAPLGSYFHGSAALIVVFGFTFLIAVAVFYFQNKERERWHATARLALEKGQPIPSEHPEMADPGLGRHRQRMGLIIAGLVNLGVGVALFLGMSALPDGRVARYFVAIPGFVGAGLLVSALIDHFLAPKPPDRGDPKPRS